MCALFNDFISNVYTFLFKYWVTPLQKSQLNTVFWAFFVTFHCCHVKISVIAVLFGFLWSSDSQSYQILTKY